MPAPDPLAPFLEPLERLGIPYCITGTLGHVLRFVTNQVAPQSSDV